MAIIRPSITFQPTIEEFFRQRSAAQLTVLSGPNNSGKSYLLKSLCNHTSESPLFFGCNRFFSLTQLSTNDMDPNYLSQLKINFTNHHYHPNEQQRMHNDETNFHNLEQILRGLTNSQRETLFGLFQDLIGNTISLKHTTHDNEMTPLYVDVDGESLQFGSTGTRLLLTLLGSCFDTRFKYLFLDEPELGLSPRIQSIVGRFFSDESERQRYFPHLKGMFVSTHSHLFLDRRQIKNNFIVAKNAHTITTDQVQSISQFHQLQFNLLGNDLESIFMPSGIVIVEGKTEQQYLKKVLSIWLPDRKITVVLAGGDGELQKKLHTIREAFGDLERSPYHTRMFLIFDETNNAKFSRIIGMGVEDSNVFVWSKNGIEFYYPREILKRVFACGDEELTKMNPISNNVEINGVRKSKTELADIVCSQITKNDILPDELSNVMARIDNKTS